MGQWMNNAFSITFYEVQTRLGQWGIGRNIGEAISWASFGRRLGDWSPRTHTVTNGTHHCPGVVRRAVGWIGDGPLPPSEDGQEILDLLEAGMWASAISALFRVKDRGGSLVTIPRKAG